MKRIVILSWLVLSCLTLAAKQSSYSVYEFRGSVLCKQKSADGWTAWMPVKKNIQLGVADSLHVKKGTYVRIKDDLTEDVYRSVSEGKMRVLDLVIQARKQSTQRVEKQVNDNVRKTVSAQEQQAMSVYGTSTREYEVFSEINFVVNHLGFIISEDDPDLVTVISDGDSTANLGALVIPSEITYKARTYKVTGLADNAFRDCLSLTAVTIPDSMEIGAGAFSGCVNLAEIRLPEDLLEIADSAFMNCKALRQIVIPDNVVRVGAKAFFGAESVSLIVIGEAVRTIGEGAFGGIPNIKSIEWKSKNILKTNPLSGVKVNKVETVILPADLPFIPESLCAGMSALREITIPQNVTRIGRKAFQNCAKLTSITLPEGVTTIEKEAFYGCSGLTQVVLSQSLTTIGDYAFFGANNLTSIVIPDNVTTIGDVAFGTCGKLKEITFGQSLESLGNNVFRNVSNLQTIHWNVVNYPSANPFKGTRINGITSFTIGDEVKQLPAFLCAGMSALSTVEIPLGVTSVGDHAFADCRGLTTMSVPASVTQLGEYAFANCPALTSVTLPNNMTTIPGHLFTDCIGLQTFTFPESITAIDSYAFYGCIGLTSLNLPEGLITIESHAFGYCQNLPVIVLPQSLQRVGEGAFQSCSELTTLAIGANLQSIGNNAFEDCVKLTSIYSFRVPSNESENECRNLFEGVDKTACTLFMLSEAKKAYKTACDWTGFRVKPHPRGTVWPGFEN